MSNIEKLKQELLLQKETIEKLGGEVLVANSNPSPAEITQGILTLDVPDLSGSTATENDVLYGKTFFSGSDKLRVGQFIDAASTFRAIYEYVVYTANTEGTVNYHLPEDIDKVRDYMFHRNKNSVNFYFHNQVTEVGSYAFYENSNFNFYGLNDASVLRTIGNYAFSRCTNAIFDFEGLPQSLYHISSGAFIDGVKDGYNITIPAGVQVVGSSAFSPLTKRFCGTFTIPSNSILRMLDTSVLENIVFDCDFYCSPSMSAISSRLNYNGSFNNVDLSAKITSLGSNCFNVPETCPLSEVHLKTVTFHNTTPPTTFFDNCFSTQAVENGLKIYVPDESYEAYLAKLSAFASCVYPASQKE